MPRERHEYWVLIEVEQKLRNALSMVRDAERMLETPGEIRDDLAKIADDLGDAMALTAAARRRALETPEARAA